MSKFKLIIVGIGEIAEVAHDYFCGVNDREIMGYVEHDWEMPLVPKWCPLLVKEQEGE